MLPLSGVTVLSLEHAVAAPFATRQLADLGARVIKVERPATGDFARQYDESVDGLASYFVWLNRSKESICVDVKSERGNAILTDLADRADVIVQNLGPGAAARLGLDPNELRERDPRKIVLSITGWGSTGPWAERKAYDLLVQCETGLLSLTGTPDDMTKVGISIADIAAGTYGFASVLAALFQREIAGIGATLEVSLFEALAEWIGQPMHFTAGSGTQPGRFGAQHATIAPYGPFSTSDGHVVLLAIQNEPEWQRLCTMVFDAPSLAGDPRFRSNTLRVTNRDELDREVTSRLSRFTVDDLIDRLSQARIAFAGVNTVRELLDHPVLEARDRWRTVHTERGSVQALLPPIQMGTEARMDPVPALGQHSVAIARELGVEADEIDSMLSAGLLETSTGSRSMLPRPPLTLE
ncbi:CaiB/BaiF CoA-transferase family protein [Gordonia sp. ABSL11-1]|uniref:CaiB/BaiF CoA transferase family protein n=1 Tax=Gordonia sp. ABSL11-1 TaxID=3053924 RepID=UPI0025738173|nr:CaiB/BaiF CoA-transferase family protein [Gordonia sp. ABSL11-1]MDL9949000.1 CaiB/BaiF CoA-transferase family protein [Gordonia sp. ABSL11-1]